MEDLITKNNNSYILNIFSFFLVLFSAHYSSVIFLGEINTFNKLTFGLYVILISSLFFYKSYHSKLEIKKYILQIFLLIPPAYILYSFLINQSTINLGWFLGDLATISAIIFTILLARVLELEIVKEKFIEKLMFILFLILIVDFISIYLFNIEGKIRSFSRLIIVPSFYIYKYFQNKKINHLYIIITCFFMSIISNMRYAFIIMILMLFLYGLFFNRKSISSFFNLKNISLLSILITCTIYILIKTNLLQQWSFYFLFTSAFRGELGIVNVFLGRYLEILDVYTAHISQFNAASIFFGNGLGASYTPNEFLNFYVADYSSSGAIAENISRHIIHFGPVRFYFRYGGIGLILIYYIFYKNILHLHKIFKKNCYDISLFFSLTLFLYLLRFFLQPIFNDIAILYCLLGFFMYEKNILK